MRGGDAKASALPEPQIAYFLGLTYPCCGLQYGPEDCLNSPGDELITVRTCEAAERPNASSSSRANAIFASWPEADGRRPRTDLGGVATPYHSRLPGRDLPLALVRRFTHLLHGIVLAQTAALEGGSDGALGGNFNDASSCRRWVNSVGCSNWRPRGPPVINSGNASPPDTVTRDEPRDHRQVRSEHRFLR